MTSIQQNEKQQSQSPNTAQSFIEGFWGVRYQVKDVQRAITFYTQTLGFNLDMQYLPAFGQVSIGGLKLILSGSGASGVPTNARWAPTRARRLEPRPSSGPGLTCAHCRAESGRSAFRNEMEVGPGGKQIQIEDPDGNPIELFEPAGH